MIFKKHYILVSIALNIKSKLVNDQFFYIPVGNVTPEQFIFA